MLAIGWRVAAAAFVSALSLAGPQAHSVAVADSPGADSSAASSDSAQHSAPRRGSAGHATRGPAAGNAVPGPSTLPAADTVGAEPVALGPSDSTLSESQPAPNSAAAQDATVISPQRRARQLPSRQSGFTLPQSLQPAESTRSTVTTIPAGQTHPVASATVIPPAVSSTEAASTAVLTPAGSAPSVVAPAAAIAVAPKSAASTTAAKAAPIMLPTLRQVIDALVPGVVTVIDKATNWLSTLPANPVTTWLSGVLLLVRREIDPAPPVGGAVAGTKVTIRDETAQSLEIWAYYDGSARNQLVYVTTLEPGGEWSNTASNDWFKDQYDHNLIIGSAAYIGGQPAPGPTPKSLMQIAVSNDPFSSPVVRIGYQGPLYHGQPTEFSAIEKSSAWSPINTNSQFWLSQDEQGVVDPGNSSLGYGPKAWVYRGEDIDSGSWFRADTKNIIVSIWQLPSTTYNPLNWDQWFRVGEDPSGLLPDWDQAPWWGNCSLRQCTS